MRSNGGSGESTSSSTQLPSRNPSSQKSKKPPVLKKFKTIAPNDPGPTPHFSGPLFPTVRRVTSLPPSSSDRRVASIDTTDASAANNSRESNVTSNSNLNNVDVMNSFSDRDWMYHSFLGPHAARNQVVTVKAALRPSMRGGDDRLINRSQGNVVDEKQQSNTTTNKEEVKIATSQVSMIQSSSRAL